MAAANFAVSMELPPPTPITASAFVSRARRVVSITPESCGFCSTPPKTAVMRLSFSIMAFAVGAKCLPQAITQRCTPSSSRISPSLANVPAPK